MDVYQITKDDIEFFFNKYKNNSDQIFHLERKLLTESYDFKKWEDMLDKNSELTRKLFVENEDLLNEYIRPVIEHPEQLSLEAVEAYALHTTFYLFENNIDSLVTEDLISALLSVPEKLSKKAEFELNMNLGISKTVTCHESLEEALKYYNRAMEIFPDFASAPDDDMRVHQVFCLTYKLLAYDLYKSNKITEALETYNQIAKLVRGGNADLYSKMWGESADFDFHLTLLERLMRVYVYFVFGQGCLNSSSKEGDAEYENSKAQVEKMLSEEYKKEKDEGYINPMIFTFYHKNRFVNGELSENEYEDILFLEYQRISSELKSQDEKISFIYPEMAFPDDGDPVPEKFSCLLDKMKLFNWSFSYVYILLPEFFNTVKDVNIRKGVTKEILRYHENAPYAAKGFQTDDFIVGMVKTVAESLETVEEFMSFIQSIFVHRETNSSIHFRTVSTLVVMCLNHMIDRKPELFITKDCHDVESLRKNRNRVFQFMRNAGMLHDIGKIGLSNLINLHFRRITDKEFQKIKKHTVLGGKISSEIEYLKPYHDLIMGHHKWHDGKGGYPEEFDSAKSDYSIFIDLLTLCDCLDTATDFRGRNYARKKNFDLILDEFKADDGFRYNKDLVKIIDEDEALKEELRYMTTTGRNYTSYETYQNFIMPNTTFSEEDEKNVVEYEDEYAESLFDFYRACYPESEDERIKKHIQEQTALINSGSWVLKDKKEKIFGILSGQFITPLNNNAGDYFLITDFAIRPDCRRRGLGMELLTEVEKKMSEKNLHSIKINVANDFGLESFIWIAGFVKTKVYLMEKQIQ